MVTVNAIDAESFNDFVSGDNLILLEFWAAWCGPCKMMSPVLDDLAGTYEEEPLIGKINIDECVDIAEQYRVVNIPTMILLKDGKEMDRTEGYLSKTALWNWVERALKK